MLNQKLPILKSIDTYFEPLMKRALQAEKLGVCYGVIGLDSVSSSCGRAKGDRLKLSIPYARQHLVWNVLFDSQYPETGPDFTFNDETFLSNPDADTLSNKVPSLAKWDPHDGNALLNVLTELLQCYKQHQIGLLAKQGDRLEIEYSTLMQETEIKADDVELILLPHSLKPTEARFIINMAIDFSQLPSRVNQSHSEMAMLIVTFYGTDWNRIVPQLYLSKSVEEAFGGPASLHIPPFPRNKYLMDYVPEVKKFITEKIKTLVQSFGKKKEFMATVSLLQRGSMLEYDAVEFTFVVILLELRDFHFNVKIELLPGFPSEKPMVKLISVYHMTPQGKLYAEVLDDVPYSPRWDSVTMVTKLLAYIVETAATRFQNNSIKISSS